MRVGLATSLVAHAALITLGVLGLHHAKELEPMAIESISVDLVPIEEIASIRAGTENSDVIETPAPAVVDTPDPAKLAERPGATEKDQPQPEETQTPSPAPTVQTAPEPAPEPETEPTPRPDQPAPQPEPQPEPEKTAPQPQPDPQSEPAPDEQPAPELASEPDKTETPSQKAAPVPAMRTAAIETQRAAHAQTQPKKSEPADKVADIINTESSRGSTTGSGGQAAAGKPTGQAARLTQSELGALIAQMRNCWNPTLSERNDGVVIHLLVTMNRDGTVAGMPEILTDLSASPMLGISARTAARKVQACGPFNLPADKYDHWQQIDVTLDASQAD